MTYIFTVYLFFWKPILTEMNDMQEILQTAGLDASAAKLGALVLFLQNEWDNVIEEAKIKAADFCEQMRISTEWRIRKKRLPGEDTMDVVLSLQDEIKWEQYEILDRLHEKTTRRLTSDKWHEH